MGLPSNPDETFDKCLEDLRNRQTAIANEYSDSFELFDDHKEQLSRELRATEAKFGSLKESIRHNNEKGSPVFELEAVLANLLIEIADLILRGGWSRFDRELREMIYPHHHTKMVDVKARQVVKEWNERLKKKQEEHEASIEGILDENKHALRNHWLRETFQERKNRITFSRRHTGPPSDRHRRAA